MNESEETRTNNTYNYILNLVLSSEKIKSLLRNAGWNKFKEDLIERLNLDKENSTKALKNTSEIELLISNLKKEE